MRPSELWKCKISVSKDSIIYFDLTDNQLQLKTTASHRLIPLHEELLKMGNNKIGLDLSECTFIYSVGIGKIVYFIKKMENIPDSYFKIKNPTPRIRKLLELVKLSDFLE